MARRWSLATNSSSRLMSFEVALYMMILMLHILRRNHTVYLSQTSVLSSPVVLLASRQLPSWDTRWKLIIGSALRLQKSKAFICCCDVYTGVVLLISQVKLVLHQSLDSSLLFGFCRGCRLDGSSLLRLPLQMAMMTWTSTAIVAAEIIQSWCSDKNALRWVDLLLMLVDDRLIIRIFHAFRMF